MFSRIGLRGTGILKSVCFSSNNWIRLGRAFSTGAAPRDSFDNIKVGHPSHYAANECFDLMNALMGATTCDGIAKILKTVPSNMTDLYLAYALTKLAEYEVPITPSFDQTILPFTLNYLKKFNRENGHAFSEVVIALGQIGIQDAELWNTIRQKIVKEKMHRYVPVKDLCSLVESIAHAGQADASILQALGSQIIKHHRALKGEQIEAAVRGFEKSGLGADGFTKSLEEARVRAIEEDKHSHDHHDHHHAPHKALH